VAGVDLAPIEPPLENENVVAFCADLTESTVAERLLDAVGGQADVVLADAAPKLSGVRATDRAREQALLEAIEALLPRLLRRGGDLLVKILEAPEAQAVERRLRRRFARSKSLKPGASRRGTSERYLLARGYTGAAEP
jgi:23S rRNA (uridine2552-2'-O)-methyltransferase